MSHLDYCICSNPKDSILIKGNNLFEASHKYYPSDMDSCFLLTEEAYLLFRENEYWSEAAMALNGIATLEHVRGNLKYHRILLDSAIQISVKHEIDSLSKVSLFLSSALYFNSTNQMLRAEVEIRKVLDLCNTSTTAAHILSVVYNNYGLILWKLKDYQSALAQFENSISLLNDDNENELFYNVSTHLNVSSLFKKIGEYDIALRMLDQASLRIDMMRDNLSEIFFKQLKIQKTEIYYELDMLPEVKKLLAYNYIELNSKKHEIILLLLRAKISLIEDDENLEKHLDAIEEFLLKEDKNIGLFESIEVYGNAALYFIRKDDLDKATHMVELIQHFSKETFNSDHKDVNPVYHKIKCETSYWLLYIQKELGDKNLIFKDNDELALECKSLIQSIQRLNQLSLDVEINAQWIENINKYSKLVCDLVIDHNLDQSLVVAISELNRSSNLTNKLFLDENHQIASIPDDLIISEQENLGLRAFYQNKLSFEKDSLLIESYNKELARLDLKNNEFLFQLKLKYPKYFKKRYESNDIDIADVQDALEEEELVIQYLLFEYTIYTIVISKEKVDVNRNSISDKELDLLKSISTKVGDQTYPIGALKAELNTLYNLLFDQIDLTDYARLSIFPHGVIQDVPFNCLVDNNGAFLLFDKSFNYQFNIASFLDLKSQKKEDIDGIFSYSYSNNFIDTIQALQCGEKEIAMISEPFGFPVQSISNRVDFLKSSYTNSIIHIASHAESNTSWDKSSNIIIGEEFISDKEIRATNLSSPMVVLSACNTGTGENIIGEGNMSLNRSLFYSNCKSSIVSRWKVDDCSTSEIMKSFYNYLKKYPKDIALQKAQIDFINNSHPSQRHPFYWASFHQSGSYSQLYISDNKTLGVKFKILCFILFLFIVYASYSKMQKK